MSRASLQHVLCLLSLTPLFLTCCKITWIAFSGLCLQCRDGSGHCLHNLFFSFPGDASFLNLFYLMQPAASASCLLRLWGLSGSAHGAPHQLWAASSCLLGAQAQLPLDQLSSPWPLPHAWTPQQQHQHQQRGHAAAAAATRRKQQPAKQQPATPSAAASPPPGSPPPAPGWVPFLPNPAVQPRKPEDIVGDGSWLLRHYRRAMHPRQLVARVTKRRSVPAILVGARRCAARAHAHPTAHHSLACIARFIQPCMHCARMAACKPWMDACMHARMHACRTCSRCTRPRWMASWSRPRWAASCARSAAWAPWPACPQPRSLQAAVPAGGTAQPPVPPQPASPPAATALRPARHARTPRTRGPPPWPGCCPSCSSSCASARRAPSSPSCGRGPPCRLGRWVNRGPVLLCCVRELTRRAISDKCSAVACFGSWHRACTHSPGAPSPSAVCPAPRLQERAAWPTDMATIMVERCTRKPLPGRSKGLGSGGRPW